MRALPNMNACTLADLISYCRSDRSLLCVLPILERWRAFAGSFVRRERRAWHGSGRSLYAVKGWRQLDTGCFGLSVVQRCRFGASPLWQDIFGQCNGRMF